MTRTRKKRKKKRRNETTTATDPFLLDGNSSSGLPEVSFSCVMHIAYTLLLPTGTPTRTLNHNESDISKFQTTLSRHRITPRSCCLPIQLQQLLPCVYLSTSTRTKQADRWRDAESNGKVGSTRQIDIVNPNSLGASSFPSFYAEQRSPQSGRKFSQSVTLPFPISWAVLVFGGEEVVPPLNCIERENKRGVLFLSSLSILFLLL